MKLSGIFGAFVASLGICSLGALPARADDAATLQSLLEHVSPSIVIVKVVMKSSGPQGGDRQAKADLNGVVVDSSGLIMIPNILFSYARVSSLLGRGTGQGGDFKTYPTEMTTIFDQDDKEYPTTLVATDTKLDLAFVRIEKLGDKKLVPIDFTKGASGSVGQEVISISRLHKGFDYAPYFMSSRICGVITKPKKAFLVEGGLESLGLPVFTVSGEPLGVLTTLEPGLKEEALIEGMTFHNFTQQIIGGKGGVVQTFVLPWQTVVGVVSQAKLKSVEVKKAAAAIKSK